MTDNHTDDIRDLLARAMSDAPQPHDWADVEQRAQQLNAPSPPRRRTGLWLAAAACTIALVGGLVAVIASGDEPQVRIDTPDRTTPSTVAPTSAPAPTTNPTTTAPPPAPAPSAEAGWTGGLLDDIDANSLRPLQSLAEGDAVVPTAPTGWRLADAAWTGPDDAVAPDFVEWSIEIIEARPDHNAFGHVLYLTQSREPTCRTTLGCRPSGDSVTINGVEWESIVVERIPDDDPAFFDETTLRARIGDRWVSLAAGAPQALTGVLLENPPIIEFLEGLRASSPDELAAIGEACWQCGAAGAEGDPFSATELPAETPTTVPDGATTATIDPGEQAPTGVSSDTGRALTDLAEGDVVVPTYIPADLRLMDTARIDEQAGLTTFSFDLEANDGEYANSVYLTSSSKPLGPDDPSALSDPNHPPVEIAGLTWAWDDFNGARRARIGSFSISVNLRGLDPSDAERFIDGLRAISIGQFPGPIEFDVSETFAADWAGAEVVASVQRFELAALHIEDKICTGLREKATPATRVFGANCHEPTELDDSAVLDFSSYRDEAGTTRWLVIGVIDSTDATVARITAPTGESVDVTTGPVNQFFDGRFFLADVMVDDSLRIGAGEIIVEDASP